VEQTVKEIVAGRERVAASRREFSRRQLLRLAAALASLPLASGPPRPATAAAGRFVAEIAPGVFVHQGRHALFAPDNAGDISNAGFVVGADAVAVIDTGGSARVGTLLKAALREVTDRPVRYVINTHMHPDHVFGNAAFAEDGVTFVAHHKMARGLAARADRYLTRNKELLGAEAFEGIRIIMPTRGIEGTQSLDLGGRALTLTAQPTAHTDNDLTVRCTRTGTLFLGDLLFSEHVPTIDGSILGWIALMERLTLEPAERVVPGHGPPAMAWPEGAKSLRGYLDRLAADVRALIRSGKTLADAMTSAGQSEKGAWLLFEDYNARNASAAFAELEWEQ
jgi:quinoprotein relay system zinc metallohydrolase 2